MVRTITIPLNNGKGAVYRVKLPSGGSSVVVLLEGISQPGMASISKTSGDPIPADNTPKDLYPLELFKEAIALTAGFPYKKLGSVILKNGTAEEEPAAEETTAEEVIVDSDDYKKIVDAYTDKNGKLSYALLNKDMIQLAHSSNVVAKMAEEGKSVEEIRNYIAGSKFRSITGNHNMTDEQVEKIGELLDEVSPKGVYKELNEEIRKMLREASAKA